MNETTALELEIGRLEHEIDQFRLENQLLQDQINALMMELHDLKAEVNEAEAA